MTEIKVAVVGGAVSDISSSIKDRPEMETDVYQGGCMQKTKNRIRERQLSNG
jgi:hypothetical protein